MADDYPRKPGGLFDPNVFGSLQPRNFLADYARQAIPTERRSRLSDLVAALDTSPTRNSLAGYRDFSSLGSRNALLDALNPPPKTPTTRLGALDAYMPPSKPSGLFGLGASLPPALPVKPLPVMPAPVKRKVFFSFHYDDLFRVNNVRQIGKIGKDRETQRNFYDSSLWESKKLQGPESLKALIRNGMQNASAVCVLIGSHTWQRRWVKYEIARAVIERRGLFALHINGLNHVQRQCPDNLGFNPLRLMGVYHDANGNFYLYEMRQVTTNALTGEKTWRWLPYQDFTQQIRLPKYAPQPAVGYVMPLSSCTDEYFFDSKEHDLGAWIDKAARAAGR